jgi:hypothetical protein
MDYELQIVRDSLKVFEKSTVPAIQITARYKLREDILPLSIKGSVFSEDDKFLSHLSELPPIDIMNNPAPGGMEHGAASDISYLTSELTKVWPYEKQMMFTLDKGTLDYIEERSIKPGIRMLSLHST